MYLSVLLVRHCSTGPRNPGQQIKGLDVLLLDQARASAIKALEKAVDILAAPPLATRARIARFFAPTLSVNSLGLVVTGLNVMYSYADILDEEDDWIPSVAYEYYKPADPTEYAESVWPFPFIDGNLIKLSPKFFSWNTSNRDRAVTLIHEWTHTYLQAYDNDGGTGPDVYIGGDMSPMGAAPIYASPIADRLNHADTLARFAETWV